MGWSRHHWSWTLFGAYLLLAAGCSWQTGSSSSTLVLAVENLGFERVVCESDNGAGREGEGLQVFCDEGIRFTHAYTTSTLTQPALASLLTGLYPLEHSVHNNGKDSLPASIETVAEVAAVAGARTSLISGGPPILRKSGLAQGFEWFDDNFPITESRLYRPAGEVVRLALSWLDHEVGRAPFFSLLYFSDLQFPEATTVSDLGEVRDRSLESQLKELSESLSALIRGLRARGRWHSTHVILVGLKAGVTLSRSEPSVINVFGENTQVALFFKPSRRSRDQGPQWTIDKNVSLADVGSSIYELQTGTPVRSAVPQLARVSLLPLLNQPQASWDDNRVILVESGWGAWRGLSPIRFAARSRHYLYIHDLHPRIYNTLLDRLEQSPLPDRDPLWTTLDPGIISFFRTTGLEAWSIHDDQYWQRLLASREWWLDPESRIGAAAPAFPMEDSQVRRWRMSKALAAKDWNELSQLADPVSEPIFSYVARRQLGLIARPPLAPCAQGFVSSPVKGGLLNQPLGCGDELFSHLLEGNRLSEGKKKEWALGKFFREFRDRSRETAFGAANYARLLPWDVPLYFPSGASLTDLYLSLDDHAGVANQIRSRSSTEDQAVDL